MHKQRFLRDGTRQVARRGWGTHDSAIQYRRPLDNASQCRGSSAQAVFLKEKKYAYIHIYPSGAFEYILILEGELDVTGRQLTGAHSAGVEGRERCSTVVHIGRCSLFLYCSIRGVYEAMEPFNLLSTLIHTRRLL